MRAVSNTSPLSNLAVIDRLDLLRRRYGIIHLPPAVAGELSRITHIAAHDRLTAALRHGWLVVSTPPAALLHSRVQLDPGETEAIALAVALKADVLLIDEKRGRTVARQAGLTVAGVLGELLHGKLSGAIPAISPEVRRLRIEAGFFIDAGVEQFILSQAGELPG